MDTVKNYMLREAYKKIHKLGDRLAKIELFIDREAFRPIINYIYDNKSPREGRPTSAESFYKTLITRL